MKELITIEDFWRVDDLIKKNFGKDFFRKIDYCGLEPIRPLQNFDYFCTPINSKTFAATGGDGVHFGILDFGPIVMTVPIADINNIVLAENLNEFFSIGYFNGWFTLEQLAYDFDNTIDYYSKPDDDISLPELTFLELVRQQLSILHIPLSKERLKELEERYFHLLELPDFDKWSNENLT